MMLISLKVSLLERESTFKKKKKQEMFLITVISFETIHLL